MVADKIVSALVSRTPEIIAGDELRPAAVLILIQERADGDYIVLTKRGDNMPTHKGQIAFPGGRAHAGDADLVATALRESHEEIGVVPEHVRVLGRLDEFTAGYGIVVTPVVGVIPPQYEFLIDLAETSAVASVPICSLMEPSTLCEKCPPLARRSSELPFLCQQWLGCLGRHRAHPRPVSRTGL